MVRLANALLICSLAALPASGQTSAARTPNPKTRSERPAASHLTVTLIATELFRARRGRTETGTPTGTVRGRRLTENLEGRQRAGTKRDVGGVDGTRTRGLRRDRPAF